MGLGTVKRAPCSGEHEPHPSWDLQQVSSSKYHGVAAECHGVGNVKEHSTVSIAEHREAGSIEECCRVEEVSIIGHSAASQGHWTWP